MLQCSFVKCCFAPQESALARFFRVVLFPIGTKENLFDTDSSSIDRALEPDLLFSGLLYAFLLALCSHLLDIIGRRVLQTGSGWLLLAVQPDAVCPPYFAVTGVVHRAN